MQAIWQDKVIAESDRTIEVGGYRYFPRDAVRMDLLEAAPKTDNDLKCPHGVRFYDVVEGEAPQEKMKPVDHWIGFWKDVGVR